MSPLLSDEGPGSVDLDVECDKFFHQLLLAVDLERHSATAGCATAEIVTAGSMLDP